MLSRLLRSPILPSQVRSWSQVRLVRVAIIGSSTDERCRMPHEAEARTVPLVARSLGDIGRTRAGSLISSCVPHCRVCLLIRRSTRLSNTVSREIFGARKKKTFRKAKVQSKYKKVQAQVSKPAHQRISRALPQRASVN